MHIVNIAGLCGDPVKHPAMDTLPLPQLLRQQFLANQNDRGTAALVNIAHDLDHVARNEEIRLVDDQRPTRPGDLLRDLVDHVGDGPGGAHTKIGQDGGAELLGRPGRLHLYRIGTEAVGGINRSGSLAIA